MGQTTEKEDRTTLDQPERDGWVALLLLLVIALVAILRYHGLDFGRW